MFAFLCGLVSMCDTTQWQLYFGAHNYWKNVTFHRFNVHTVEELLNVEPSIDHIDFYNASIPDYIKSAHTLKWVQSNYDCLPRELRASARKMVCAEAAIVAANAMCHPRARVGNFNWMDVMELHNILPSLGYGAFLREHEYDNQLAPF